MSMYYTRLHLANRYGRRDTHLVRYFDLNRNGRCTMRAMYRDVRRHEKLTPGFARALCTGFLIDHLVRP